jgi:hypothetical protein
MMRQPGQVLLPGWPGRERSERGAVQRRPPPRQQGFLHDLPGDLMPELGPVTGEHHNSGAQALVQHLRNARH